MKSVNKKILIINENRAEAEDIRNHLIDAEAEVVCAYTLREALTQFMIHDFVLIILDAYLSATDDHSLLKAMRSAKKMPILILSSDTNHTERIHLFQAGANAYMGKPYTLEECMAQAHSLMQLYVETAPQGKLCYTLAFGNDLLIDPETRQAFLKGKELKITRKEFDLLFWLASNPGKVFTREQLYDHVWDEQSAHNVDEVVKHHIKTLRKKLTDANSEYIKNVWGIGYRFEHGSKTDGE